MMPASPHGRRPRRCRPSEERAARRRGPESKRHPAGCRRRHRPRSPGRQRRRRAGAGPGGAMGKRPLRAERPVLPRPRAAVLSARWGLTAEFGMGSGDPPLHGSARGRRSRAALYEPLPGGGGTAPAPPWRPHARDGSRSATCLYEDVRRRARAISSARLSRSPCLQLRPIDLVVYEGPYRRGSSSRRRLPT